jgi:hypothetical protein
MSEYDNVLMDRLRRESYSVHIKTMDEYIRILKYFEIIGCRWRDGQDVLYVNMTIPNFEKEQVYLKLNSSCDGITYGRNAFGKVEKLEHVIDKIKARMGDKKVEALISSMKLNRKWLELMEYAEERERSCS